MNPPHNTPIKYIKFICKLKAGDTRLPAGIKKKAHLNEIPSALATILYRAAHYSAQRGSVLVLMLLAHL